VSDAITPWSESSRFEDPSQSRSDAGVDLDMMKGGCAGTGARAERVIEFGLEGSNSTHEADALSWGKSETGARVEVRQREKCNFLLELRGDISLAALEDNMVVVEIEGTLDKEEEVRKALPRRTEGVQNVGKSQDERWCLFASVETARSLDDRVDSPSVAAVETFLPFTNPVGTAETKTTDGASSRGKAFVALALRGGKLLETSIARTVVGRVVPDQLVATGSSVQESYSTTACSSKGERPARRPGVDSPAARSVPTAQSTTFHSGLALGSRSIGSLTSNCDFSAPEVTTDDSASTSGKSSQESSGLVKSTSHVGNNGSRALCVDKTWHRHYSSILSCYKETGECRVESRELKNWLTVQREQFHNGVLAPWKVEALNCVGINWIAKSQERVGGLDSDSIEFFMHWGLAHHWKHNFDKVKAFYDQYGHLHYFHAVCEGDSSHDFNQLTRWDVQQRVEYKKYLKRQPTSMVQGRVNMLRSIHFFDWQEQYGWNHSFEQVLAFFNKHGHLVFGKEAYSPQKVKDWSVWSAKQRRGYVRLKNGRKSTFLNPSRVQALNRIGLFHPIEKQMYRFVIARLKVFRETSGSYRILSPEKYEDATGDSETALCLKATREEYSRFLENPVASYLTRRAINRLFVLGIDLTSGEDDACSRRSTTNIHTDAGAACKAGQTSAGEQSAPAARNFSNRSMQCESMKSPSMTRLHQSAANDIQCFAHKGVRAVQEQGSCQALNEELSVCRVIETGTKASAAQDNARLLVVALEMPVVPNEKGTLASGRDPPRVDACSVTAAMRPGGPKHGEPTEEVDSARPETGTVVTDNAVANEEARRSETFISHDRVLTTTSIVTSHPIEDNRTAVTPHRLTPGPLNNHHNNRLFQGSIDYDQAGVPGFADSSPNRAPLQGPSVKKSCPDLVPMKRRHTTELPKRSPTPQAYNPASRDTQGRSFDHNRCSSREDDCPLTILSAYHSVHRGRSPAQRPERDLWC
jgi:hypothetical protein